MSECSKACDYAMSQLCHAKANLFLEVLGKRGDGFHDIVSVFQPIYFLYDTLHARLSDRISMNCDNALIPCGENNLIIKAATLLRDYCAITKGIDFYLEKKIPDGGGLGGGSSDAAAALMLCNELWQTGLSSYDLCALAAQIGSDVPYFIHGGVCLCEGRGEIITKLENVSPISLGVFAPDWKIATPAAYQSLDPSRFNSHPVEPFINALKKGEEQDIYAHSYNCFEEAVFRIEPRQKELFKEMQQKGLMPRMSGSGSCMLSFFGTPKMAQTL